MSLPEGDTPPRVPASRHTPIESIASVPIDTLRETIDRLAADGHTLELVCTLVTGYTYRGQVSSFDATGNLLFSEALVTCDATGRQRAVRDIFVRGDQVMFLVLPTAMMADYDVLRKRIRNKVKTEKRRAKRKVARIAVREVAGPAGSTASGPSTRRKDAPRGGGGGPRGGGVGWMGRRPPSRKAPVR